MAFTKPVIESLAETSIRMLGEKFRAIIRDPLADWSPPPEDLSCVVQRHNYVDANALPLFDKTLQSF